MQRRSVTRLVERPFMIVVLLAIAANVGSGVVWADASPPPAEAFTIVVLPDTQYYCFSEDPAINAIFAEQTTWIVDHKQSHNIRFVLHEGDVIDGMGIGPRSDTDQWNIARDAMSILDGHVPYVIAPGNHDYIWEGDSPLRVGYFNDDQYFGPSSPYGTQETVGGFYEAGKTDNSYHLFRIGETDWLVIALQFGPPNEVVEWANEVAGSYPDHDTILLTHAYLCWDDTLLDTSKGTSQRGTSQLIEMEKKPNVTVNDGQELWDKLVKANPNIRLVFCGHVTIDGVGLLTSIGDHGQIVHQMLANYQSSTIAGWGSSVEGLPEGGNGYMRLIDISTDGIVNVRTYSPRLDQFLTDPYQEFTLEIQPRDPGKEPQDLPSMLTSAENSINTLEDAGLRLQGVIEHCDLAKHLAQMRYANTAKWILENKVLQVLDQLADLPQLLAQAEGIISNASMMGVDNQTIDSLQVCWGNANGCLTALDGDGAKNYLQTVINTSEWQQTSALLSQAQNIIKELEEAGDRRAFMAKGDYQRATNDLAECDHATASIYLKRILAHVQEPALPVILSMLGLILLPTLLRRHTEHTD